MNGEDSLPAVRTLFSLVPLALGLHIAYHLQFTPVLPGLSLKIWQQSPGSGSGTELVRLNILQGLDALVILTGLVISFVCAWKVWRSKKETAEFVIRK